MKNKTAINVGNCGEYFAAAQLELHGFSTAVPMSNNPMFDLLAENRETGHRISVQVKTTTNSINHWLLTSKVENIVNPKNMYFIFIRLLPNDTQEYHIVPAAEVMIYCKTNHLIHLNTPSKNGGKHKDTSMRCFDDLSNTWLNRWDLLEK